MPNRPADRLHRRAQAQLASVVTGELSRVLLALPEPESQAAMDAYNAHAVRIVGGGQRQAAQFAITYIAQLLPPARARIPASPTRALEGRLVDESAPVARSPILRLWSELAAGTAVELARQVAGSYAGALATGDLQSAERGGLEEGARAGGGVSGWTKELSGDACAWCVEVAQGVYRSPDAVPFHDRDRCAVAPVLEEA